MKLRLYGLKNCDTCRKARKALEAAGHAVEMIDIRADSDLPAKLPGWIRAFGAERLVNRRSTTWRGLSDAQKRQADGGDLVTLLCAHPALIKRPVIETADTAYLGWTQEIEAELT